MSERSILLLRCSFLGRGGRPSYDDPEVRLILRQADQARDDFAVILVELALPRESSPAADPRRA